MIMGSRLVVCRLGVADDPRVFLDEGGHRLFVEGLTKRSGIETFLDVQPPAFPRLARELETAVFRIIQEALTNVFRHSGAQNGWVTLEQQDSQLVITIRDDGKGIGERVVEFQYGSIGVGIGGMRQRVKEFGGVLRLENTNPGTRVEVTIPSSSMVSPEPTVAPVVKDIAPNEANSETRMADVPAIVSKNQAAPGVTSRLL